MRKKWKKGIAGVLSVCLLATCVPGVSEIGGLVHTNKRLQAATTDNLVSGECGEKATWSYNKTTKTLTISGSGEMWGYYMDEYVHTEDVLASIPWGIYREEIKKIIIGDKITNVGAYVFMDCTSLKEVKLGKKVSIIDDVAFWGCTALKKINFTDEIKYIGYGSFGECNSLTTLYVGKNLKKIDDSAFDLGGNSLKQIKVHKKNKYYSVQGKNLMNKKKTRWILSCFGASTTCQIYAQTTSFNSLMLENSTIQNFKVSSKNKKFSSENGLLYSKDKKKLYLCPRGKKGTAVISDKTTTISVENLLYDFEEAFGNCSKLEKIVLGKNINNVENELWIFGDRKLKEVAVVDGNKYYTSTKNAIFTKDMKKLVLCISAENKTYTVPEGVEKIETDAFRLCADIENLILSDSVIEGECYWTKNITLGENYYNSGRMLWISTADSEVENVTVSEKNPYYSSVDGVVYNKEQTEFLACPAGKTSCNMLDTVTGPVKYSWKGSTKELFVSDSITDISQWSLGGIEKLHLGKKVEKIPEIAEKNLQITVEPENETFAVKEDMLYNKIENRLIWCLPVKKGVATVASGTAIVDEWVFYDCNDLTEIVIPDSVTTIEAVGCPKSLERFTVDSANKNYKSEDGILYDKNAKSLVKCPMMKKGVVTVASGTAVIDKLAFDNCDEVTEIIFPETIRKVKWGAFSDMYGTYVFHVPAGMKEYFETLFSSDTRFSSSRMVIKEIGE